ncbi:CHAD domain-containing protein [Cupriavidus gilardii J11]|uniref:CHAD domain-containing protein n=1 Tax=Cupriavidus gilardii J11 TaxID=936133 RepID=A0A562BJP1_9BURK|nr:CHAD domain-containing protein [Cupriavidus gilardii]TWG85311.1 CHAD domain-containing protein [Cupriavidus gilardii J11]
MAPPHLKRRMGALDAFVALAAADLDRLAATLRALERRDHPEDLHRLRIGLRRLRALRWMFAPVLPGAVSARWRQMLADMMAATGPARDWDVLIDGTLQPALVRHPRSPVLRALLDEAMMRRDTARTIMLAELTPYRERTLPLLRRELAILQRHCNMPDAIPVARSPLKKFARKRVRRARRLWLARKREVAAATSQASEATEPGMPPEFAALANPSLHAQRIAAKRLRYAIEALAPVLPRRYRGRLLRKVARQQQGLGAALDAAVARRLIATLLASAVDKAEPARSADGMASPAY